MKNRRVRVEDIRISEEGVEFHGKEMKRLEIAARAYFRATGEAVSPQEMGEMKVDHMHLLNMMTNRMPEELRGQPVPPLVLRAIRHQAAIVWHMRRLRESVDAFFRDGMARRAGA